MRAFSDQKGASKIGDSVLCIDSHATIFCNHLANLLQKIIASQKPTHHITVATIFCSHLAKLDKVSDPAIVELSEQ
jgi:hypothetical protein